MTNEQAKSASFRLATIQRQLTSVNNTQSLPSNEDQIKGIQTILHERSNSSFEVRLMTYYLDGGEHITKIKEEVMNDIRTCPGIYLDDIQSYDLSHESLRETTLARVRRIYSLLIGDASDLERRHARLEIFSLYDMNWYIRNGVHFGLFMGAIMGQGDDSQKDEWMPPTITLQIYGCFAMTELGHGSNLKGLETTATFDIESDTFIIHSPTETSTKWWIGAAGQTATHCICLARLLIKGEDKGIHNFIVPLRDLDTHMPLPGIQIGDCGVKMGLNGIDNGWIKFNHVRIPRANLLRKYAQVSREGLYTKPPKAQMAYGNLISTRGDVVMYSCNVLKKALMISIRYSAIRRQGGGTGLAENKLLDYQSHQYRLMPLLATAYAYHFQVANALRLVSSVDEGVAEDDPEAMSVFADVHATMAGLKAFGTWTTSHALEKCRQACGGHGYSAYNALGSMVTDFAVMCTWEGDNTVMAQQTARYLINSFKKLAQGKPLSGSVRYLEELATGKLKTKWSAETRKDVFRHDLLLEAIKYQASLKVQQVAHRLQSQNGMSQDESWNNCQVDLIEIARVHVNYNVSSQFISQVAALQNEPRYASLLPPLTKLCNLFILYQIQQDLAFFLENSYFSTNQASWIHEAVILLCKQVREEAVPLVDAFNYSDEVLNSCIGRYDGNIYETYLNAVKHRTTRAPYYEAHIKPMLDGDNTGFEDGQ